MNRLSRLLSLMFLLLAAESGASPADAQRVQKSWDLAMEKWSLEARVATTADERSKAAGMRPDPADFARQMWQVIGNSLDQEWTLDPAAWFLRATFGLVATQADGSTSPAFTQEIAAIRKALESHHLASRNLIPMCLALATLGDPGSLAILEKIQADHPDPKIQGIAALSAAMILKNLGDTEGLMRKRLTYLRKAIIQSSEVDLGGTSVSKLAEDELYIIRFLTKGRVAPDLTGSDAAGRPIKLSDHQGKVILLLFWGSTMREADRVIQITTETVKKFQGRPLAVIGVNQDPLEKLRSLEADGTVTWPNFSDPSNQLAAEYRVGTWPLVYVLDGDRKVHYSGAPGSFAELTAEALLSESKPTTE